MSKEDTKATDAQRMANVGEEISLKKLGRVVTVKELTMESVIKCAAELSMLLNVIDWKAKTQAAVILQLILQSEPTARAFRVFAAESTETMPEDWVLAPASDWLKFLKAAKNVNDWEELKELFMELGLGAIFQAQMTDTPTTQPNQSNELPTPQPN